MNHIDRTYEFLRGCIDRHLDRTRERTNRGARVRALEGKNKGGAGAQATPALAQDPPGGKPDKKSKGNGKG